MGGARCGGCRHEALIFIACGRRLRRRGCLFFLGCGGPIETRNHLSAATKACAVALLLMLA
jgi:hypothetical protein